MLSPREGLNYAESHGFTSIIDIPYEFLGDCMDTLIGLRESFGVKPKWNNNFESEFDVQGIHIKITSALYYQEYREKAYYRSITNEIEKLLGEEESEESYKQNLTKGQKELSPVANVISLSILIMGTATVLLLSYRRRNKK